MGPEDVGCGVLVPNEDFMLYKMKFNGERNVELAFLQNSIAWHRKEWRHLDVPCSSFVEEVK